MIMRLLCLLLAAILAISAAPVHAQDQPNVVKLKADAERVVKSISSDKRKLQTYCEFADLSDQIGQANEDHDAKKAEELSKKADELAKKLGPEFAALADEFNKIEPNSQDSQEIGSIFDKLDKLCEH
jgi:ABC-type transporter Mla subunit MlaD